MKKEILILGSPWTITEGTADDFPALADMDGYTDTSTRMIIIEAMQGSGDPTEKQDLQAYKKTVIRHELIHAFLYESGLDSSTAAAKNWATCEEMVDWLALQIPKILKVYTELGVI